MQSSKKIEEFKVSIRRKHINQKIANLRAKTLGNPAEIVNAQEVIAKINSLFTNGSKQELYGRVEELKKYSQSPKIVSVLKDYFEGFYRLLSEVDVFQSKLQRANQLYRTISTILINILSLEEIDFSQEIKHDIANPLLKNISKKEREIDTLWLIANILFRNNGLSIHFMEALVQQNIWEYIAKRRDKAFDSASNATIFYYFVGALTSSLGFIDNFNHFRALLKQIVLLSESVEECYLYVLDGLAVYASSFTKHQYEIFETTLFKRCEGYCIGKKTLFVRKYLQVFVNFISGEASIAHDQGQEGKKLMSTQYLRFKKFNLLKNMEYCLDNRSPEVKKLLLEAAIILVTLYFDEIDLSEEYYYLALAEEIKNIDKLERNTIFPLLKYMEILIIALLKVGTISKHSEYSESFLKFIESNSLFQKIEYVLRTYGQFHDLLNICIDIIAYLQEYDIPSLRQALGRTNLLPTLESLEINQPEISKKRDILAEYIRQNQGEQMMNM